jgi:hypothetical protein
VDNDGRRFHNESEPYEFVMKTSANRPVGKRCRHQVWDANWKADIIRFHTVGCSTITYHEGADHDAYPGMEDDLQAEFDANIEGGYIVKADTLEELGKLMGIEDVDTFLETCERQNENFDAQLDADFGKEPFRLSELRTPPFCGMVKTCGFSLCTTDGDHPRSSVTMRYRRISPSDRTTSKPGVSSSMVSMPSQGCSSG